MEAGRSSMLPFLADEIYISQIARLADSVCNALPDNSTAKEEIKCQADRLRNAKQKWHTTILEKFRERVVPLFSAEQITKLNQTHSAKIEEVNSSRKATKTALLADITRLKKQKDDLLSKKISLMDTNEHSIAINRAELSFLTVGTPEYRSLRAKMNATQRSFELSTFRLTQTENENQHQLREAEDNLAPVRIISNSSSNKHLILQQGDISLGWVPHLEKYEMIQNPKTPSKEAIFRHISYEPESKATNLPLSLFNLISFADRIGATDQTLLTMVTHYLKEYRPEVLNQIDSKKGNIRLVIEELAYHCNVTAEKQAVLQRLKSFTRSYQETFSASISRFNSLHVFYLQLEKPADKEVIKAVSYSTLRSIAPYLISTKCAQALAQWISESVRLGQEINKENLVKVVSNLESYEELQLRQNRSIPQFMIQTTLNLPAEPQNEVNISAHLASGTGPQDQPSHISQHKTQENKRPPKENTQFNRAKSPAKDGHNKPRASSKSPKPYHTRHSSNQGDNEERRRRGPDAHYPRTQSKSPNNKEKSERGRSPFPSAKPPSRSGSYSTEVDALQYHTIFSESPGPRRKTSMPSMFRRALTPKTMEHLKGTYFHKTNANKFSDVRTSNRCLRCYSSRHLASTCPRFTRPCVNPCRLCWYLFHPSQDCPYFDSKGNSRSSSAQRK